MNRTQKMITSESGIMIAGNIFIENPVDVIAVVVHAIVVVIVVVVIGLIVEIFVGACTSMKA